MNLFAHEIGRVVSWSYYQKKSVLIEYRQTGRLALLTIFGITQLWYLLNSETKMREQYRNYMRPSYALAVNESYFGR